MPVKKTVNTKVEKVEKEIEPKVTSKRVARKQIGKDLEIMFVNNTSGVFSHEDNRTNNSFVLSEYGDYDYITFDELRRLKNQHYGVLAKYWILLAEVNDDEITLDDVIKALGIEDLYNSPINIGEMDNFLLKTTSDKFDKTFSKLNINMQNIITERTVELFKDKKFSDYSKMKTIERALQKDGLFENISSRMND